MSWTGWRSEDRQVRTWSALPFATIVLTFQSRPLRKHGLVGPVVLSATEPGSVSRRPGLRLVSLACWSVSFLQAPGFIHGVADVRSFLSSRDFFAPASRFALVCLVGSCEPCVLPGEVRLESRLDAGPWPLRPTADEGVVPVARRP